MGVIAELWEIINPYLMMFIVYALGFYGMWELFVKIRAWYRKEKTESYLFAIDFRNEWRWMAIVSCTVIIGLIAYNCSVYHVTRGLGCSLMACIIWLALGENGYFHNRDGSGAYSFWNMSFNLGLVFTVLFAFIQTDEAADVSIWIHMLATTFVFMVYWFILYGFMLIAAGCVLLYKKLYLYRKKDRQSAYQYRMKQLKSYIEKLSDEGLEQLCTRYQKALEPSGCKCASFLCNFSNEEENCDSKSGNCKYLSAQNYNCEVDGCDHIRDCLNAIRVEQEARRKA